MVRTYIEAAIDSLKVVQSDHLATVLLEVKTDIDGKSAMDMALEYRLYDFVANSRVERVSTSIMNDWEFLRPCNRYDCQSPFAFVHHAPCTMHHLIVL